MERAEAGSSSHCHRSGPGRDAGSLFLQVTMKMGRKKRKYNIKRTYKAIWDQTDTRNRVSELN